MKILDSYDLTRSFRDAGELAGCSHHTVKAYVERRAAGGELDRAAARPQLIDEYLPKVEEWVERSNGKVRADVAHEKLLALGYTGSERTTRRAVAQVKAAYRSGRVRVHRPWVTEPGMWLQYDYGDGPLVDGVKTVLFVAWLPAPHRHMLTNKPDPALIALTLPPLDRGTTIIANGPVSEELASK